MDAIKKKSFSVESPKLASFLMTLQRLSIARNFNLVVLASGLIIFGYIFLLNIRTDLQSHAEFVSLSIRYGIWQGNFLFYFIVALLSGFTDNIAIIHLIMTFILAFSLLLKFMISKYIAFSELKGENLIEEKSNGLFFFIVSLTLFLFIYAHSLPVWSAKLYLGQIPTNNWHNSTTIFLMPFALLLFYESHLFVENRDRNINWIIPLLCLVNLAIKPSFFFVFAICFPLYTFIRCGFCKKFGFSVMVVFLSGFALLFEYFYIYNFSAPFLDEYYGRARSGIKIDFLNVWARWSDNIPLSFLASFALPISYFAIQRRNALKSPLVQYSSINLIVALVIFLFMSETGPREFNGNFFWQLIVCNYILFLVVLIDLMKNLRQNNSRRHLIRFSYSIFMLHVFSGLLYLLKIFLLRSYY